MALNTKSLDSAAVKWALIINLSADSFSGDGVPANQTSSFQTLRSRLDSLLPMQMDWIDVGAVSTRPGSHPVRPDDEWQRLEPALKLLAAFKVRRKADGRAIMISLDTTSPMVAKRAARMGIIDIINDVWAGRKTESGFTTLDVAAEHGCAMVLMHMLGEPGTMQQAPRYQNCIVEVQQFLRERCAAAQKAGVPRIYVDPGIGFGKDLGHNLELLSIPSLAALALIAREQEVPAGVLIGLSRKRFIHQLALLNKDPSAQLLEDPAHRDAATKEFECQCIDRFDDPRLGPNKPELVIRSHRMPAEVPLASHRLLETKTHGL
jgi:dihydropteroate synthase